MVKPGHHTGLPAAYPCSTHPPNQAPAMAIPKFGCLFPPCLVSSNSLTLAPNHFYHGAGSQHLSWATKTGRRMRWVDSGYGKRGDRAGLQLYSWESGGGCSRCFWMDERHRDGQRELPMEGGSPARGSHLPSAQHRGPHSCDLGAFHLSTPLLTLLRPLCRPAPSPTLPSPPTRER